jgi:hypothetical protein
MKIATRVLVLAALCGAYAYSRAASIASVAPSVPVCCTAGTGAACCGASCSATATKCTAS